MRIGLWDIETSPDGSWHYGPLWKQSISIPQLREVSEVICFGWKWYGDEGRPRVYSLHKLGKQKLLQKAWDLLNEADAVVSWNGKEFDTKKIDGDFWTAGMLPPAPYRHIDLMRAAKKRFLLTSNKLQFVSQLKGLEGKIQHEGFPLWIACMEGDLKAWRRMNRYCQRDVELLEPLFESMRPWIPQIPSHGAFTGEDVCPACGSSELHPQGFAYLTSGKYQRYLCGCGKWSRSSRRVAATSVVEVA